MSRLIPRTKTPELEVETLTGGRWRLSAQRPRYFTMVVAYRGLHCPICRTYLAELDHKLEDFRSRGVDVIALSTDERDRAQAAKESWELKALLLGYGLTIEQARAWGLYISAGRGKTSAGVEEPALFNEPGLFLVRPDQTLYALSIASMPFARPHFDEILAAVDFIIDKDYPARGEA